MWSTARRWVWVSLVVGVLLAALSGSAAAHDERCELELREAPIEDVPPLPGWTWREVVLEPDGWRGRLEWSGGDLRAAAFAIACACRASIRDNLPTLDWSSCTTAAGSSPVSATLSSCSRMATSLCFMSFMSGLS